MSKQDTRFPPQGENNSRPSLYLSSSDPIRAEQHSSILSSLEPDRVPSRLGVKAVMFCVMVGLLATALYWANVSRIRDLSPTIANRLGISIKGDPNDSGVSKEKIAAKEAPVVTAEAPKAPAVIVAESMPIAEEMQNHSLSMAGTEKGDASPSETMQAKAPAVTPLAPLQSQSTVSTIKDMSEPASQALISDAKPAVKEVKSTVKAPHHHSSQSTAIGKQNKDQDVEIIAALLAKTSATKDGPQKGAAAKSAASINTTSRYTSKSAGIKTEKQTDPRRDVVTRASGESTDVLVKRCQALGFFEGELCRFRICSGRWGSDPGCPGNTQFVNN